MDKLRLGDQLEPIYNSVPIQDVALTTREQWRIETDDERESGKSILAARHDDDDFSSANIYIYIYSVKQAHIYLTVFLPLVPIGRFPCYILYQFQIGFNW